jgi:hypothetical protein
MDVTYLSWSANLSETPKSVVSSGRADDMSDEIVEAALTVRSKE